MSTVAARIPKLSAAKLELLTRRLRQKGEPAVYAAPIRRRDPSITRPPLSFAQQRLWFVQQLEPNNVAYNIPLSVRLSGPLNVAVLERSLSEVVRRHEVLRTAFENNNGQPVQIISPPTDVKLPVIDLSNLSDAARVTEVARQRRHEALTRFDLSTVPLWRAKLLRLGADEHVVLLTLHHAISDAWSMSVLTHEIGELYRAFAAGQPSPLEELPVQYADYAIWQREWLRGEVLDTQLDYWRRQLSAAPTHLELPSDGTHAQNGASEGATHSFTVPPEVSAKLKELGRREDATLFMLLLAAFAVLLSRYSGQQDILIGTPIAGRQRVELERLIGFFVNTLVLRADLSGNPSFREFLRRVRQTTLSAYAHQDVPFEKLVDDLQPDRSVTHTRLFQVLLVMQNTPRSDLDLEGLRFEELTIEVGAAKHDLTLVVQESERGLLGTFVYDSNRLSASTIAQMTERLQELLRDAADEPNTPIGALARTSSEQQHELLSSFNAVLE
jgi:hypothetical protein